MVLLHFRSEGRNTGSAPTSITRFHALNRQLYLLWARAISVGCREDANANDRLFDRR